MRACIRYRIALPATALVLAGAAMGAQTIPASGAIPRNHAADSIILSQVKAPPGFEVTVFARPPVAMYPTCLTTAPDGAVYVCVDGNLSLSTDSGRGRIVHLVDTDDDGRADRYSVFAEMDSPRGVIADGRSVFVMHPPTLTAYRDTTGDGIADLSEDLVTGLGFDLDFRGADHATNGITLGIDGWIYIAVGDYGFVRAVGKDGTTISRRGGSVVRVRPDGTGLEIYAVGTRNIYDVAVDPLLNVFSRDNTNDGDGWDTRLHHLAPGANMGYPSLYRNFSDEHMPSLAELGAGAGTGALWVHDPGFPDGFDNMLYTGDWTLNKVFRHPMQPKGASFSARQEEFLTIPHPSDMAMDGRSNMYVASLAGGQFTYSGDTVGYVVRLRPSAGASSVSASPAALTGAQRMERLLSDNAEYRLQAQREILRRGSNAATVRALEEAVADRARPTHARVTAMFTLLQLTGDRSHSTIQSVAREPGMRAMALRALADRRGRASDALRSVFERALDDPDPAVQLQAVHGLVRLGSSRSAADIARLTESADPAVAHVAVNALVTFNAREAALDQLRSGAAAAGQGTLRALQQMHAGETVAALIARVERQTEPAMSRAIVGALARLYHREAPWTGDWWGTQPSFTGPYFAPVPWSESARIAPVLRQRLLAAKGDEFSAIADILVRNRVVPSGAKALLAAIDAAGDTQARADVVSALVGTSRLDSATIALLPALDARSAALHAGVAALLAAEPRLHSHALPLVRRAVLDTTLSGEVRGALITSVARLPGDSGLAIASDLVARLNPFEGNAAEVETAWRRFVGDRRRVGELDHFINMARTGQPEQRTLAYSVLVQAVRSGRTPAAVREKVAPVIAAAWTDPASAPSLVQAITTMRLDSQYADQLAAYRRPPRQ